MNTTVSVVNSEQINDYSYPLRDPLYIVIPLTVIYSIIFLTGVLGNVITCIVISRNKSMHTATNYYLFSLAVSDLLLLVSGLPQEIYNMWYNYPYPFNEAVCVFQGFAAETSANATVLTITAFTIERYVAICHPFLSHTMSKLSRAVKFVLAIWLLAMCLAIPQTLDLGITHYNTCTIKRGWNKHIFAISTIIVFVFPMAVITILYILIGLQLRKSKVVNRGSVTGSSVRLKHNMFKRKTHRAVVTINHNSIPVLTHQQQQQQNGNHLSPYSQQINANHLVSGQLNSPEDGRINYSTTRAQSHGTRHVVNMLVAVVVAFFICWAPFHAQRLFATYLQEENNDSVVAIYIFLTHISGVLYFISTCINPFLYNIMSYKFREAFKDTLARYLYRRTGHPIRQGRLFRNVSQRSISINSHSANTCSSVCSTQFYNQSHSLRYLDTELAPFQTLKRPLVVSFRRIPKENNTNSTSSSSSNVVYDFNEYNKSNKNLTIQNEISDMKKLRSPCHKTKHLRKNITSNGIENKSNENINYDNLFDINTKEKSKVKYLDKSQLAKFQLKHFNKTKSNKTDMSSENSNLWKSTSCQIKPNINIIKKDEHQNNNAYRKSFTPTTTTIDNRDVITSDDFNQIKNQRNFKNGINKFPSDTNIIRNEYVSCIFYPSNESSRFELNQSPTTSDTNNKSINNLKQLKYFTYKSPYESPELSTNSKKLEENLRKILEDLVLYPKISQREKLNTKKLTSKNKYDFSSKNMFGLNLKSQSLPSINLFELYQSNIPSRRKQNNDIIVETHKMKSFHIMENSIDTKQNTRHQRKNCEIKNIRENILECPMNLNELFLSKIDDNEKIGDPKHPLNILIQESENSFNGIEWKL